LIDSRVRFSRLPARFTLAVAFVVAFAGAAHADLGITLGAPSDSITNVTWTLSNGTRVLAQHIPFGHGISISVGYPGGSDQDPPGRGGLAALLAELQFTAAAGELPDRTRLEMPSLRPFGADVHVGKCFTILSEVANRAQLPGVLHQVAIRMRGVQVTPQVLATALVTVRSRYAQQFQGPVDLMLFNELAERGAGADEASLRRLATVSGLEKLTVEDVTRLLAKAFASQRAVIAIAGDLSGFDLRAALERELAGVPGGPPGPLPAPRPLHPFGANVRRPNLARPVGVLGIIAPALADSSYPAFFLASMVIGAQANAQWGEPVAPLSSRFQFSVLEDPELTRFYPPLTLKDRTAGSIAESFGTSVGGQDNLVVSDEIMASLRFGIGWLIGGPLTDAALRHMRTDGGSLILLSCSMVERELRGGEAFWRKFRAEVDHLGVPDLTYWLGYMRDPKLQMRLMVLPDERPPGAH